MLSHLKFLFLSTGNSCRSQIAEAWARKIYPELEAQVRDEICEYVASLRELTAARDGNTLLRSPA